MLLRLLFCFLLVLQAKSQRFLREGFSNQMESDFKGEMKLEENESASGMTREMFLMKEIDWELQPVDFKNVRNAKMRRHLESFFNQPVKLKLSTRKGKYGLRAVAQLQSGKRLRAFWRQVGGAPRLKTSDFLAVSYEDAIRARLSVVEFEVQLPPPDKKSKTLPSVVFTVSVEPGTMNAKAIIPRGAGTVRVLPDGHSVGETAPTLQAGKVYVSLPMRAGLVDPSWAKGRAVFRKGRPTGTV
jgi:hypothetical protein